MRSKPCAGLLGTPFHGAMVFRTVLLQTVLRCGCALAERQCKRAFDFPLAAAIAQLGAIWLFGGRAYREFCEDGSHSQR